MNGRRNKRAIVELVELTQVHVVEIERVDNPVLRSLVTEFYGAHFPPRHRGSSGIPPVQAKEIWNRDPRKITSERGGAAAEAKEGGGQGNGSGGGEEYEFAAAEEATPDIEQLLAEVMQQEAGDFNARRHDMFKRHMLAASIKAQALVEYWDEEQQKMQRWRIVGSWCTLSRAVPLRICGKKIDNEWMAERQRTLQGQDLTPMLDATGPGASIALDLAESVSGQQFFDLLIENGNFSGIDARAHLERVYGTELADDVVFAPEEDAEAAAEEAEESELHAHEVCLPRTKLERKQLDADAQRRAAVAETRIGIGAKLAARCMSAVQLQRRCAALMSERDYRAMVRPEFISLGLRAILLNHDLCFIGECYRSAVQIEMLARGPKYILPLSELLRTQPEKLCIDVLRRKFATESNLRALALLPDLDFAAYESLVEFFQLTPDPGVMMGIDLYHNVLRRDLYGYETFAAAAGPHRSYNYSSSHMFTVFGVDPDDRRVQYYHDPTRRESSDDADLFDRSSLSAQGSFAVPWRDHSVPPAQVDFVALAESINTPELRAALHGDYYRLRQSNSESTASLVTFLRGLYWLAHTRAVVLERFIGTGPNNAGLPVDAFFLAEIYDTQRELVNCLSNLSHSSRQALNGGRAPLADAECVRFREQVFAAEQDWRKRYDAASKLQQQQQAKKSVGAAEDEPLGETIEELARSIASDAARFEKLYEAMCAAADGPGPYDSVREKFGGRWRWWPLQRVREYSREIAGTNKVLAAEQVETLERMLRNPIVITSGPGGVGKSEVAVKVIEQYPPEQVLCVGFTGKVASELKRRTGHDAFTLHRVLYQLSLWLATKNRARSFRRNRQLEREKRALKPIEEFTETDVKLCKNLEDLRAYIEYQLGAALLPFASPFEHVRVLIMDELSLLAFPLFARFLQAAHAPDSGTVLQHLYVFGDINQLPAIGVGSIQSDFAHGLPNLVSQLVVNHRSSGTELFALAQAVARHLPFDELPLPQFDRIESFEAVRSGAGDIVAIETLPGASTVGDDLAALYADLGADDINSERTLSTQCIAATNDLVDAANAAIRGLYHVDAEVERFRQAQLDARGGGGALQVVRNDTAQRMINAKMADDVTDHEAKLRKAMSMQLRVGDRFFVRANKNIFIKGRTPAEPNATLYLYNGELRRVIGFYDAPRILRRGMYCRCGLCPPKRRPGEEDCMARLDVVPRLRRVPTPANERGAIKFHDQNLAAVRRHDNKRRMMVTVNESGEFIEFDVGDVLPQRSRYDFGFAVTTHKMQGSQNDCIVIVCPDDSFFLCWRDVYTAITRAKRRAIILSSTSIFARLVMRKAPVRRTSLWLHLAQALDPTENVRLGAWPEPLISASEEQRLWLRFEHKRTAAPAPATEEVVVVQAYPPTQVEPKKRKTRLDIINEARQLQKRRAAAGADADQKTK